jgi:hypothetical protein
MVQAIMDHLRMIKRMVKDYLSQMTINIKYKEHGNKISYKVK